MIPGTRIPSVSRSQSLALRRRAEDSRLSRAASPIPTNIRRGAGLPSAVHLLRTGARPNRSRFVKQRPGTKRDAGKILRCLRQSPRKVIDVAVDTTQNRDRILPFPRTITSMRLRRTIKERDFDGSLQNAFINISLNECDMITFLFIRNGENVYRINCDLDFGEIRMYPGNYDDYMMASTAVRERQLSDNAKKKAQIAELQDFVSRFSANASKAKQATSRAKQMDKIKLDDIKPSSRVSPFIRFDQDKKLFRLALEVTDMSKGFDGETLFSDINMMVEVGERIAIIGPNGIGKTTLLRTMYGDIEPDSGSVKWSENVTIGYYAQDHASDFEKDELVYDWMDQWKPAGADEQFVRGTLGRMLFSADDIKKSVKVLSGGEQGRMLFGKIMQQKPNVLLMDEPTNHLDMESIEALNLALDNYEGTLIFVSHDREFVSSLATRIIELTPTGVVNFSGSYEEYLASQA